MRFCGEVDNNIWLFFLEESINHFPIAYVNLYKSKIRFIDNALQCG